MAIELSSLEVTESMKKSLKPISGSSMRFFKTVSLAVLLAGMASASAFAGSKRAEIVVDADNGRVLFEDNATAARHPASITKVMTLYLLFEAIESGKIGLDDPIVFSRNAANQRPTKLGVRAGASIDVETAILGLVIKSANDAAVAVAEKIGGSEANFANLMNAKAREIGMTQTKFYNASGLPNPKQVSSAEDLAKLAIAIRRDFPRQYHWFARESFVFGGKILTNHNHLVGKVSGVDGLKTGYTAASGYNLAATSVRDGRHLVTVVLGGSSWRTRDQRVESLIETAYNQLGINGTQLAVNNPYQFTSSNISDDADVQALFTDSTFKNSRMNFNSTKINLAQSSNKIDQTAFVAKAMDKNDVVAKEFDDEDASENTVVEKPNNDKANQTISTASNSTIASNSATVSFGTMLASLPAQPAQIIDIPAAVAKVTPAPTVATLEFEPKIIQTAAITVSNEGSNIPALKGRIGISQPSVIDEISHKDTANDKNVPAPQTIIDVKIAQIEPQPAPNASPSQVIVPATQLTQSIPQLPDLLDANLPVANQVANAQSTQTHIVTNNEIVSRVSLAQNELAQPNPIVAETNIPADLAKILEKEELERKEDIRRKQVEKARLAAKLEQQKRDEAKLAALKKSQELAKAKADKEKQLADAKAKIERAAAAKAEQERQLALSNRRGNVVVQVGAFKQKDDAQKALTRLASAFPNFAKREVTSTQTSSGTWFRARFSGLAIEAAKSACISAVKAGAVCQIISQ